MCAAALPQPPSRRAAPRWEQLGRAPRQSPPATALPRSVVFCECDRRECTPQHVVVGDPPDGDPAPSTPVKVPGAPHPYPVQDNRASSGATVMIFTPSYYANYSPSYAGSLHQVSLSGSWDGRQLPPAS